ncbi:hypothetical protein OKW38_003882 [Paraburkholderia sp. MM5496-R1]
MKTLSFLTHQDIYDQSVSHLFEQKRAALLLRASAPAAAIAAAARSAP